MLIIDWVVSLVALAWLIVLLVFDIRKKKVSPYWTGIPLSVALAIRVLTGVAVPMAAVAVVIFVVSERRHLKHKGLEMLALAAGIVLIALIFFISDIATQAGIGGLIVFWVAWELHLIHGSDAMTLITCMLLWPQVEFLLAYLAAGLVWSLIARIREGGWLKGHSIPMPMVIVCSAVFFLAYQLLLLLKII